MDAARVPFNPPSTTRPQSEQSSEAVVPRDSFETLSPSDQQLCRDNLQKLAAGGRLFVKQEDGTLERASGLTAYRVLQSGEGDVENVVRSGEQSQAHESKSSSRFYEDYYSGYQSADSSQVSQTDTHVVGYVSSQIQGFPDVLWLDPAEPGLPGNRQLPQAGTGTVTTSEQEAHEWEKRQDYAEANQVDWHTSGGAADQHSRRQI